VTWLRHSVEDFSLRTRGLCLWLRNICFKLKTANFSEFRISVSSFYIQNSPWKIVFKEIVVSKKGSEEIELMSGKTDF